MTKQVETDKAFMGFHEEGKLPDSADTLKETINTDKLISLFEMKTNIF